MLEEITSLYSELYEIRALVACLFVGVVCGVLGCFIVLRNMALIGDALSHAILPGVVVGFMVAGHSIIAYFTGSVIAGLIAALLITWLQRNVKTKEDAAIGVVFSTMFAIGVMGLSWLTRKQGVHLDMKDFLFGNILGVSNDDLWLTGLISIYVIICVILLYRYLFITTFEAVVAKTMGISVNLLHYFLMLLLSFTIVASLQSVGVILVIAMLTIPASTAYFISNRLKYMIIVAGIIGACSTFFGLTFAILLDTTPGPAMTLFAAVIYGLTILFAPRKGLIIKKINASKKRKRITIDQST